MHYGKGSLDPSPEPSKFNYHEEPPKQESYKPEDFDDAYERYKLFKETNLNFEAKYEVRRQGGYLSSFSNIFIDLVPKFLKKEPEGNFKKTV